MHTHLTQNVHVCVFLCLLFETGSQVILTELELAMQLGMTLNACFSCLYHLPNYWDYRYMLPYTTPGLFNAGGPAWCIVYIR